MPKEDVGVILAFYNSYTSECSCLLRDRGFIHIFNSMYERPFIAGQDWKKANPIHHFLMSFPWTRYLVQSIKGVYEKDRVCFGEKNADKTFMVLQFKISPDVGLTVWLLQAAELCRIAEMKNYIPIIDIQDPMGLYWNWRKKTNNDNVWEAYFQQLSSYSLSEVYKSKNVLICHSAEPIQWAGKDALKSFQKQHAYYRQFIQLQPDIEKYFEESEQQLFPKGKRILGVSSRSTDYMAKRPAGHPVQPDTVDLIARVEKNLHAWACDYVFLITEDIQVEQKFRAAFAEQLITFPRKLVSGYDVSTPVYVTEYQAHSLEQGHLFDEHLAYITSIYCLSRCTCFTGAIHGASRTALVINGHQYENIDVINLGLYQ